MNNMKRIFILFAAVALLAAPAWSQVDPCAPVTDTVTVTFKLDDGSLTGNFSEQKGSLLRPSNRRLSVAVLFT